MSLDLSKVTNASVFSHAQRAFERADIGSDRWRVLGATLELLPFHSFVDTRTYPRPDHPDPRKRLPLSYLLAAILISLRTTLENEMRAVDRLIEAFPTERELLAASPVELAVPIQPAGMADSKSARIVACFRRIDELPDGLSTLRTWPVGEAREYLLSLPGVGPKAADCMLTIGLGIPSMVVDVNVFRMATGLFGVDWLSKASYANTQQVLQTKRRLDLAVGGDAFLCQIVHTTLLLEGKRLRVAHSKLTCRVSQYCAACGSTAGDDLLF